MMRVAVVGGGAAGFFFAANAGRAQGVDVEIFESAAKPMRKVLASGAGRCNLANSLEDIEGIISNYPRGGGFLRKVFRAFSPKDAVAWFERHGVKVKTLPSGKIFPEEESSALVAEVLEREAVKNGAKISVNVCVSRIEKSAGGGFEVFGGNSKTGGENFFGRFDAVLLCCGGFKDGALKRSLEGLGHTVSELAPALYALKTSPRFPNLSGISVRGAMLTFKDENKRKAQGDLLFTFRGVSGPAVYKLTSFFAREFKRDGFKADFFADLMYSQGSERGVSEFFRSGRVSFGARKILNLRPECIAEKLWLEILSLAQIPSDRVFAKLSSAEERRIAGYLTRMPFKSEAPDGGEVVTCGGIKNSEVDFSTMQSKIVKGLFFAGECLDIDGLTGGFNLQNAWCTARVAAAAISQKL